MRRSWLGNTGFIARGGGGGNKRKKIKGATCPSNSPLQLVSPNAAIQLHHSCSSGHLCPPTGAENEQFSLTLRQKQLKKKKSSHDFFPSLSLARKHIWQSPECWKPSAGLRHFRGAEGEDRRAQATSCAKATVLTTAG